MSTFDFTGTDGDPLPSPLVASSGTWEILTNQAVATGTIPAGGSVASENLGSANASIEVDWNANGGDSAGTGGLALRYQDQDNFIQVLVRDSDGLIRVYRRQGGSATQLTGTYTIPAYNASSTYRIGAVCDGDNIDVTVGGSVVASYTEAAFNTQTVFGIRAGRTLHSFDNLDIAPLTAGTIIINSPQYRFWQRAGAGASVTLDGTYTGTPTTIERQVDGGAWVTAVASPAGGTWTDTFTLATGVHTVAYRFSNEVAVSSSVSDQIVGMVIVGEGQSNMSGRGVNNQVFSDSAGGIRAYMLGNDDNWKVLIDPSDSGTNQVDAVSDDGTTGGSWILRFCHHWLANNEIPICYIPCALGGTEIDRWRKTNTTRVGGLNLYESAARRIALVGGCEWVFHNGGGRDANNAVGTTATEYQARMEEYANDIMADFGVKTFIIPINNLQSANYDGNGTTTGKIPIRDAQIAAAAANANIEIGQSLWDIDLTGGVNDGLHFKTDVDLDTVGSRMYTSFAAIGSDVTPPVITLTGANPLNLTVGDPYVDPGATATDDTDGDITANIVVAGDTVDPNTVGTYNVTYDVQDAAGNNATTVTRTVNVNAVGDTTAPVITLLGANPLNLTVGETYTDPGATATDDTDGDITANIVVGGDVVNTSVAGTYTVTYNVQDAAGNNATTVTRTVNVNTPGNVAPVANAGANQNATVNVQVQLDGSASSDADTDPLTYSWSIVSAPVGNSATITNPTTVNPTITPNVIGTYVLGLIVNDGTVSSNMDTMTITVSNPTTTVWTDYPRYTAVMQ
ncbi:DUF5011 domain-containing protein [Aestuariibacter halophilus]|uniref:DUF5011 domain-containing protein n=1 Tax=Fluctibacter halophilus TaxID=226011 RepID=A0ABS8G5R8_9ALTE|nr:immunoglobulin-like domain-containing protein [Aestuariibacter halophilus]MCC2615944.1 DUF5011 domain-containing protein [Aestuariibacter halophilus]